MLALEADQWLLLLIATDRARLFGLRDGNHRLLGPKHVRTAEERVGARRLVEPITAKAV